MIMKWRDTEMAVTEPIRNKENVRALAAYYSERGNLRNYLLIVLSVHTALRVSDLLRLNWEDVYDFELNEPRYAINLKEKKTGKTKVIALNKVIITGLKEYFSEKECCRGDALFASLKTGQAIGRVQAYRIIRAAADSLKIGRVSCHSLRKTFGYHAWRSGVSPTVIMDIFNHSSYTITRRYLGVTQDDKDEVYLSLCIFDAQPRPERLSIPNRQVNY
jgi:integrase